MPPRSEGSELRPRHHKILRLLWPGRSLSRRDLRRKLNVHPNLIGADVSSLLRQRLVVEGSSKVAGRGRPSIPLQIDCRSRHIVGLSLSPAGAEVGRVSLCGKLMAPPLTARVSQPARFIRQAAKLLGEAVDRDTLAIGVSTTGLVDVEAKTLLISSAVPEQTVNPLAPIFKAAGRKQVIVENDMHALAARWMLSEGALLREDVLMVLLEDGRVGATMLINGRANRGCALGANEIGHMRFPIHTPLCYCGQEGCLERIFSSGYLSQINGVRAGALGQAMTGSQLDSDASGRILSLLVQGLSNAVNFMRPHRLILTGSFTDDDAFFQRISQSTRPLLLSGISDRLRIERWVRPSMPWSEIAAWTALADLLNGSPAN